MVLLLFTTRKTEKSSWVEADRIHIQMEYCNGGTVADFLEATESPMEKWQVKQMIAEVSNGLNFVHSRQLVHMDVKPDNIFR